jgi:hypothetical protein
VRGQDSDRSSAPRKRIPTASPFEPDDDTAPASHLKTSRVLCLPAETPVIKPESDTRRETTASFIGWAYKWSASQVFDS